MLTCRSARASRRSPARRSRPIAAEAQHAEVGHHLTAVRGDRDRVAGLLVSVPQRAVVERREHVAVHEQEGLSEVERGEHAGGAVRLVLLDVLQSHAVSRPVSEERADQAGEAADRKRDIAETVPGELSQDDRRVRSDCRPGAAASAPPSGRAAAWSPGRRRARRRDRTSSSPPKVHPAVAAMYSDPAAQRPRREPTRTRSAGRAGRSGRRVEQVERDLLGQDRGHVVRERILVVEDPALLRERELRPAEDAGPNRRGSPGTRARGGATKPRSPAAGRPGSSRPSARARAAAARPA